MTVKIRTTQGSTHRGFGFTVKDEETGVAVALTGATMTGRIIGIEPVVAAAALSGALALTDAANGVFSWSPSTADVAAAGKFELQFVATIAAKPYKTFRAVLIIEEAI